MKKFIASALIATSALAAPLAHAEGRNMEFSTMAMVDHSSDSNMDSTTAYINLAGGYYFTPKLVGKLELGLNGTWSDASDSAGESLTVGAKYYFSEGTKSKWVPFVEGGLNIAYFGNDFYDAFGYGATAGFGASNFLTEDISLDMKLQGYTNKFSPSESKYASFTRSGVRFLIGFTTRY